MPFTQSSEAFSNSTSLSSLRKQSRPKASNLSLVDDLRRQLKEKERENKVLRKHIESLAHGLRKMQKPVAEISPRVTVRRKRRQISALQNSSPERENVVPAFMLALNAVAVEETREAVCKTPAPESVNDSMMTDESCPDIESDSETMVSYQQSLPRLMKIRNPSLRGRKPLQEVSRNVPSVSPSGIRMHPKQTFNYVQTMKSSRNNRGPMQP